MPLESIRVGRDDYRQAAAAEYTPSEDVTLEGVWVRLRRTDARGWNLDHHGTVGTQVDDITFRLTTNTTSGGGANVPDTANGEITTQTIPWERYPVLWPLGDMKSYFLPFADPIQLTASTTYWFVLDMGASIPSFAMEWMMDPDLTSSTAVEWAIQNDSGTWSNSSSTWESWGTYGVWYEVVENATTRRGARYHVIINDNGYMTPDNLHSAIESTTTPFTGKVGQGEQEWSDLQYPFSAVSWDDWIGGIGTQRKADRDNAYTIGTGIDTRTRGQIIEQPAAWNTRVNSSSFVSNFDSLHRTVDFPLQRGGQWFHRWAIPMVMPNTATTYRRVRLALSRNWEAPWDGLKISIETDGTSEPSGTKVTDDAGQDLVYTFEEDDLNPMMTWWTWDFTANRDFSSGESNVWTSAGTGETIWVIIEAPNWPADDSEKRSLTPFARIRGTSGDDTDQSAGLDPDEFNGSVYGGDLPQMDSPESAANTWVDATWTRDGDSETLTWAPQVQFNDNGLYAQITDFVFWKADGSDPTPNTVDKFFCVAGKLYEWNEGTNRWDGYWSEVDTGNSGGSHTDFEHAIVYDGKLYVTRGNAGAIRVGTWDDGTASISWADVTDSVKGVWLANANGFLWTNPDPNTVRKWNGTAWSSGITVGSTDTDVTGFTLFQEQLHVAKEDGIWYVDDNDISRQRIDYADQQHQHNGKGIHNYGELMYFNVGNSYWRWTGATIDFKGPYDGYGSVPQEWAGKVIDAVNVGKHMYAALWASTTGTSQVLAFNGIGWHPIWAPFGTTGNKINTVHWTPGNAQDTTGSALSGAGTVTDGGRLWFAEGSRARFIELPDRTDNPNEWTGKIFNQYGWIELPWVDYGLREVDKFYRSVKIEVENFGSQFEDNLTIRVGAYLADDEDHETFHNLGEFEAGDGSIEARFPPNLYGRAVKILIGMESRGNTGSEDSFSNVTPVIRAVTVDGILRPPQSYVHSAQLLLGDNVLDMHGNRIADRDASDMWNELKDVEQSPTPIRVVFPWGGFDGFVSSLSARTIRYNQDDDDDGTWERIASVSFVEAK